MPDYLVSASNPIVAESPISLRPFPFPMMVGCASIMPGTGGVHQETPMLSNDPQSCITDLFDRWLAGVPMTPASAALVERWVILAWPVLRERYHAIRKAS